MKSRTVMNVEFMTETKIKTENQMRDLLASLKSDFDGLTGLLPFGSFNEFLFEILKLGLNYENEVFFIIDGPGTAFGITMSDAGRIRWNLTGAYKRLAQYRLDSEKREKNCRYLCQDFIAQDDSQLCCHHPKVSRFNRIPGGYDSPIVGYFHADDSTDCPLFEYSVLRIAGRNKQTPKTLNELLSEMFGFTLEFPAEKIYHPPFVIR